jgi:regulator of RNase E activity RraB
MAWKLFRREGSGELEMIGVDADLFDEAPVADLPLAVEVTIEASSTLPEFIGSAEATMDAITQRARGRIVGTSRRATQLWVLVYLPGDESAAEYTQIPLPARASVSVAPSNDPQWTLFDRVRPVDREHQSMLDLAVMAGLHAAGDTGGDRDIEHVVTGLDADAAERFAAAVSSVVGPAEIEREDAHADGGATIVVRHRGDPADVTDETWTIRQIAERHGATYDGWGCAVLQPYASKRRTWFGRR